MSRSPHAVAKAAELDRVRRLNAPIAPGPDGEDHGLDLGPAALARGGRIERVGGNLRGAGQRDATPVYARMLDAATLFERMNQMGQLSDKQAKAGHRLWLLKRAAGIDPRVTARYQVVHDTPDSDVGDESEVIESVCPDDYEPRTYYRAVLRDLPDAQAAIVDAACDWTPEQQRGHPGMRLPVLQEALDRLADTWGISDA